VCELHAPPLDLKNFVWLVVVYVLSVIPFTRNLLREYENELSELQDTIIDGSQALSVEIAAKNKFRCFWEKSRTDLGDAADYWTNYGEKRAYAKAVRSFQSVEWLDNPSFSEEDKLHAEALKDAIRHSAGSKFRLDMRMRNLQDAKAQKHREWLGSANGKKYLASMKEAERLMTKSQ
jgi:hypothetical protein